jgi:hypothetical protein
MGRGLSEQSVEENMKKKEVTGSWISVHNEELNFILRLFNDAFSTETKQRRLVGG